MGAPQDCLSPKFWWFVKVCWENRHMDRIIIFLSHSEISVGSFFTHKDFFFSKHQKLPLFRI